MKTRSPQEQIMDIINAALSQHMNSDEGRDQFGADNKPARVYRTGSSTLDVVAHGRIFYVHVEKTRM